MSTKVHSCFKFYPKWKKKNSLSTLQNTFFRQKRLYLLTTVSLITLTQIVYIYIDKIAKTKKRRITCPSLHSHLSTLPEPDWYFLTPSFTHSCPQRTTSNEVVSDYRNQNPQLKEHKSGKKKKVLSKTYTYCNCMGYIFCNTDINFVFNGHRSKLHAAHQHWGISFLKVGDS